MNSKFKSKNGMHNRQNEKIDEKDVNLLIKIPRKGLYQKLCHLLYLSIC